jgi:hypothetical protein
MGVGIVCHWIGQGFVKSSGARITGELGGHAHGSGPNRNEVTKKRTGSGLSVCAVDAWTVDCKRTANFVYRDPRFRLCHYHPKLSLPVDRDGSSNCAASLVDRVQYHFAQRDSAESDSVTQLPLE